MNYEHLDENSSDAMSTNPVPEHIAALAGLFPQVVQEGKVNFEVLRELLGDEVMEEEELFGLQWHGKAQARRHALSPSMGTLRPCKDESKDWDNTKNLYIEGDNLEVLKLLRKAYSNKVKMIYIDPPYNTGKEFVYPDNYNQSMENYLRITNQLTAFKAHQESSGRYHTDWLNMIYPRLMIARDLLREDGIIFISIDDNEVDNLKKICSEIFGESNFYASVSWHKNYASSNDAKKFSNVLDYVLIYQKSMQFKRNLLPRTDKQNSLYKYDNNDGRGLWRPDNLSVKSYTHTYDFPIINPNTGCAYDPPSGRCWMTNPETIKKWIKETRVFFGKNGQGAPQLKRYLNEVQNGIVPTTYWSYDDCGHNDLARKEIKSLFEQPPFDTPKPIGLIRQMLTIASCNNQNDIILDFFSGSSTTAHAVMQHNAEDGGNRQFIMVQLPESTNDKSVAKKAGYDNICDIAKERIRRAGDKIIAEADLLSSKPDIGFRVYALDSSNVRAWNGDVDKNDLFSAINAAAEHLVAGRDEEDLLYEILLKQGIELTQDSRVKSCEGKKIYSLGHGQYYACLEVELPSSCVEAVALSIAKWKLEEAPDNTECAVFVVDSAFASDEDKQNFCKILEQHGVASIKAI